MITPEHFSPISLTSPVLLREWHEGDLPLLEASMGDAQMTRFLGGPESPEQIAARHARYVGLGASGKGHMFVILLGAAREPAGSVGYWDKDWHDEALYEVGWSVLVPFQGRGIASRATELAIEHARAEGKHRHVHAFPSVENLASNGICRKLGFTFVEACDFDYPKGSLMRCNDWRLDLGESNPGVSSAGATR